MKIPPVTPEITASLDETSCRRLLYVAGNHLVAHPADDPARAHAAVYLEHVFDWVDAMGGLQDVAQSSGGLLEVQDGLRYAEDVQIDAEDSMHDAFMARNGLQLAQCCIGAALEGDPVPVFRG